MRGFVLFCFVLFCFVLIKNTLFGRIKYIQHSDSNAFMFVSFLPSKVSKWNKMYGVAQKVYYVSIPPFPCILPLIWYSTISTEKKLFEPIAVEIFRLFSQPFSLAAWTSS